MSILLFVLSVLAFLAGVLEILAAPSIMQQIMGGILFLIAAIFFTGAFILDRLGDLLRQAKAANERLDDINVNVSPRRGQGN